MIKKIKNFKPKDVFKAYLIENAKLTYKYQFPIIEEWMVSKEPPKDIVQWDRRNDIVNPSTTAICFYCNDYTFMPILNNPKKYIEKLKKYQMVIGIDASPYDNMPFVYQMYQIYQNLAISTFFARQGIKIIPNVRVGDDRTLESLEAYPKHTLIAIGTHGFTNALENRWIINDQIIEVINTLQPTGICVYGPDKLEAFDEARKRGIQIYQYDSYAMKFNKTKEDKHERF